MCHSLEVLFATYMETDLAQRFSVAKLIKKVKDVKRQTSREEAFVRRFREAVLCLFPRRSHH